MSALKTWVFSVVNLFHSVKSENLQWRQQNQEQLTRLKQAQVLAETDLAAVLKKKSQQLEHDLALLKTKQDAELSMFKTKCKQDVKDYKQYLASLDQLKLSIQTSYTHMPEAVAFTIHHHAKYLLNQMWDAEDFADKMQREMQLITFMTTVHEEARSFRQGNDLESLPQNTLKLIHNHQASNH